MADGRPVELLSSGSTVFLFTSNAVHRCSMKTSTLVLLALAAGGFYLYSKGKVAPATNTAAATSSTAGDQNISDEFGDTLSAVNSLFGNSSSPSAQTSPLTLA